MKKTIISVICCALVAAFSLTSCGGNDKKSGKAASASKTSATAKTNLPNYRYVDVDSVLAKYNLSKDYTEEMLRMQSAYESEARRHDSSLKSFASSMQNKYQNNQYTEQTFNSDQSKLQQMQANAQSSLEKLQASNAKAAMDAEKVIQDSIQSFIKDYNATRHYDAILYKAATLYIDPALDITDEVVEGLNARYNKVKK